MGIDWELQVGGRFAGKKIAFTLPLDAIPAMLKQPIEKRIQISKLELEELLDTQSIRWEHSSEPGSSSIARVFLGFQEFFLLSLFASAAMLIAIVGERFIQRSIQIEDGNVIREWRVFGLPCRRMFRKDQLLQVCIEAIGTRDESSDLHHVEYDIRVRHSGVSPGFDLLRVRSSYTNLYRLILKNKYNQV